MTTKIKSLTLLFYMFLLISCSNEKNNNVISPTNTQANSNLSGDLAYPVIETPIGIQTSYPVYETQVIDQDGYPIQENPINYPQDPDFKINEPLSEGDTQITGTGPANVPINLVDVSEMGLFIAETIIDMDGTFIFSFQDPLEAGHSIGIQLGDIEGTDFTANDFLYNDNYYERPLIGILFDMVVVN